MKFSYRYVLCILLAGLVCRGGSVCNADYITQTRTMTSGETWSTAGAWSNNAPASAGNIYLSNGYLFRTPNNQDNNTGTPDPGLFPGDALYIGYKLEGGVPALTGTNDRIIFKNRNAAVVTINELHLGYAQVYYGPNSGVPMAGVLEGKIHVEDISSVTANNAAIFANTTAVSFTVNSDIIGAAGVSLDIGFAPAGTESYTAPVILGGDNSAYLGSLNVVHGATLKFANAGAVPKGAITLDNGTVDISAFGDLTARPDVYVASGGGTIISGTTGNYNQLGSLHGSGTLTHSAGYAWFYTSGNDFTGSLKVDAGLFRFSSGNLGGLAIHELTVAPGARFEIRGNAAGAGTINIGKLTGTGTTSYYRVFEGHHTLKLGEGTLAADTATFAGTFESTSGGTLSIEKYGEGTQVLSGTAGAGILKDMKIYGGTLQLDNVNVAPSDSITLDGGALSTPFAETNMPKLVIGANGGTIYAADSGMHRYNGMDGSGTLTVAKGQIWIDADGNFSGDATAGTASVGGNLRFTQGDFFDVIPNLHLPMAQVDITKWEGSMLEIRYGDRGDMTSHIGRLTGAGKVQVTSGAGHTVELGVGVTASDPEASFSGVFYHNESGKFAIKKVGEGTQILNNTAGSRNGSVSEVIVDGGTLVLNGTGITSGQYANSGYFGATTPITVGSDGTLRFATTFNSPNGGMVTVNGGTLDYRRKNFTSLLTLSDGARVVADSAGTSGNDAKLLRVGSGINPVWTATTGDNVVDTAVYMLKGTESGGPDGANTNLFTLDVHGGASLAITGGFHDYTDTYRGMNVEKTGAGVLEISGSSAYIGSTAVSAGTLRVAADNALGSGALSVASGATLAFADNGITLNNSSLTVTGVLSFDTLDAAITALDYSAGLVFGTAASIEIGAFLDPLLWEDPDFEYSLIHADGGITGFAAGDDWSDLLNDSRWELLLSADGTDLYLSPMNNGGDTGAVPEPATWVMLLLGAAAMVAVRRRVTPK